MLRGSYHNGFAPRDGMPLYPSLWRGCVGAWAPCLGPSGVTLRDWSGFANHGTLTLMDAGTDWVVSGGRYALDFDGTNDHVVVLPSSRFDFSGDTPFSLSAWFYNRSAAGVQTILNRGVIGSFARDFILYSSFTSGSNFQIAFQNSNGSVFPTIATGDLVLNTWYHVVATKGPSGASAIWINGVRQVTGTLSTVVASGNTRSVVIGATFETPAARYYSSQILDDLRIYSRVLNDAEIASLASRRGIAYDLAPMPMLYSQQAGFQAAWALRQRFILGGGGGMG